MIFLTEKEFFRIFSLIFILKLEDRDNESIYILSVLNSSDLGFESNRFFLWFFVYILTPDSQHWFSVYSICKQICL